MTLLYFVTINRKTPKFAFLKFLAWFTFFKDYILLGLESRVGSNKRVERIFLTKNDKRVGVRDMTLIYGEG